MVQKNHAAGRPLEQPEGYPSDADYGKTLRTDRLSQRGKSREISGPSKTKKVCVCVRPGVVVVVVVGIAVIVICRL